MPSPRAQIDDKSTRFLRAVQYYGGEATITEIRQKSGLNRDDANYRFERLEDDFSVLEEYVYGWTQAAETDLLAIRRILEEKLGISMESYLDAAEAEGPDDDEELDTEGADNPPTEIPLRILFCSGCSVQVSGIFDTFLGVVVLSVVSDERGVWVR